MALIIPNSNYFFQACFRLFRIGQVRDVEFLRIIADGTLDGQMSIDKQMYRMQQSKMKAIHGILGPSAFNNKGAAQSFLQNWGKLVKDGMGRIKLVRRRNLTTLKEEGMGTGKAK